MIQMRRSLPYPVLAVLISSLLASETLHTPDDHPTIQEAIDAADRGGTVHIVAGTYGENLVVEKQLLAFGEHPQAGLIWWQRRLLKHNVKRSSSRTPTMSRSGLRIG
jgi:hypothetical protein